MDIRKVPPDVLARLDRELLRRMARLDREEDDRDILIELQYLDEEEDERDREADFFAYFADMANGLEEA
jgi:hypothetical protein